MQSFKINRYKAEAPVMATFFIFGIITSLYFFPKFLWWAFLVFPILFLFYIIMSKNRLAFFKRECFFILDEQGMKYSFHLYQQPKSLLWSQIDKVNYQLYEINVKLKNTGEIISFQSGYLENKEDLVEIKKIIGTYCQQM
jgi:hypothetical protein